MRTVRRRGWRCRDLAVRADGGRTRGEDDALSVIPSVSVAVRCTGTAVRAPVWMDLPVPRPDDDPRMHRVPVVALLRKSEWRPCRVVGLSLIHI